MATINMHIQFRWSQFSMISNQCSFRCPMLDRETAEHIFVDAAVGGALGIYFAQQHALAKTHF